MWGFINHRTMQMKAPVQTADVFFSLLLILGYYQHSQLPNPKPILQLTYLPFSWCLPMRFLWDLSFQLPFAVFQHYFHFNFAMQMSLGSITVHFSLLSISMQFSVPNNFEDFSQKTSLVKYTEIYKYYQASGVQSS